MLLVGSKGYRTWLDRLIAGIVNFVPYADFPAVLITGIWLIVLSIMFFRHTPSPAAARAPISA
jgi:hypothetical protein